MKIPKGNDGWGKGGGKREREEKERKEEWKGLGKAARDLPRILPNFARMLQWRKFERILRRPGLVIGTFHQISFNDSKSRFDKLFKRKPAPIRRNF